ncbi:unnamed protein product [Rhizophagus irregularis]|nr:unnamed protein product [Rhizophagus irregularis]
MDLKIVVDTPQQAQQQNVLHYFNWYRMDNDKSHTKKNVTRVNVLLIYCLMFIDSNKDVINKRNYEKRIPS